ncbi:MAG TPA: hypothetical protein VF044_02580 [Actinomycetota bacterium]
MAPGGAQLLPRPVLVLEEVDARLDDERPARRGCPVAPVPRLPAVDAAPAVGVGAPEPCVGRELRPFVELLEAGDVLRLEDEQAQVGGVGALRSSGAPGEREGNGPEDEPAGQCSCGFAIAR